MKRLCLSTVSVFAIAVALVIVQFVGSTHIADAASNGCMVMTQCPGTEKSDARPVYRYAGVDVYQREDDSGGATTFARKPDCKLQPGQCLVTVRDKDGNTVKTFLSRGLDAGAPQASPIPQDFTKSGGFTPVDPAQMRSAFGATSQDTILNSPTRMFGAFYESYSDYQTPIPDETYRTPQQDYSRTLYTEFAQPIQDSPPPEPRRQIEIVPVGHLSSESVSLEAGVNTEQSAGHIAAIERNAVTTFVDPDSVPDVGQAGGIEKRMAETGDTSGSSDNSFARATESGYAQLANVRGIPAIDSDSWVDDPHTPVIHNEVRGNLVRASDDLDYLKQLEHNNLCASRCQGDVVNRENQLRILHALDDQMTHGYTEVISLESGVGKLPTETDTSGATRYLVALQDARGETFYCSASGACTPSDTFEPASPRRNPIAVAAAPIELERAASRLSYANNPISYAFAEISGSGANVFQQIISPSPAFAPRSDYPACSLLTSLIGACVNWR